MGTRPQASLACLRYLYTMTVCLLFIMMFFLNLTYAENQPPALNATGPRSFISIHDAKRFQALIKEIRCVVCQNQNIADSNAPLANDLREKIYKMVIAKRSNEEIKNYLVKRYGEFILLQPRLNKFTFLLWTFPFMGLVCILPFLLCFRRNVGPRLRSI